MVTKDSDGIKIDPPIMEWNTVTKDQYEIKTKNLQYQDRDATQ
jgi:hypothetical protein